MFPLNYDLSNEEYFFEDITVQEAQSETDLTEDEDKEEIDMLQVTLQHIEHTQSDAELDFLNDTEFFNQLIYRQHTLEDMFGETGIKKESPWLSVSERDSLGNKLTRYSQNARNFAWASNGPSRLNQLFGLSTDIQIENDDEEDDFF